jgi:AcrR family transcriptional regulator
MYDLAMTAGPPPLDRRRRKSRAALRQSFLDLIAARSYDAITVEDITEAADVARGTFYAHYSDKAALLREVCGELMTELGERAAAAAASASDQPTYTGAATTELFRHADQHRDLYRLVLSGAGGAAPRNEMIATLQSNVATFVSELTDSFDRKPRAPISVIASTLIGGLLLTIEMWLNQGLEGSPADLATVFARTQVNGLEWALGFDHGDLLYQPRPD